MSAPYRDLFASSQPPGLSLALQDQAAALGREFSRLSATSLIGTEVGPYRVGSILGQGGQATVFLAKSGDQRVALKVPRADLADTLVREAQILFHLDHPRVVRVLKADVRGPVPYVATEYHAQGTLASRLQEGPLPLAQVVALAEGVLDALEHAHAKGVVHRDLKPANILFDSAGRACVADFGIGTLSLLEGQPRSATLLTEACSGFFGTPLYMSPEQALKGRCVDARADLYALGKVLYEALVGCPPRTIKPVSRVVRGVGPAWDDFLFGLLEDRPADRFPSARAARQALQALLGSPLSANELDVRKVVEASKRRAGLRDLERPGLRRIKVLRAGNLNQLIARALEDVLARQPRGKLSEADCKRIVEQVQDELDRHMPDE